MHECHCTADECVCNFNAFGHTRMNGSKWKKSDWTRPPAVVHLRLWSSSSSAEYALHHLRPLTIVKPKAWCDRMVRVTMEERRKQTRKWKNDEKERNLIVTVVDCELWSNQNSVRSAHAQPNAGEKPEKWNEIKWILFFSLLLWSQCVHCSVISCTWMHFACPLSLSLSHTRRLFAPFCNFYFVVVVCIPFASFATCKHT